MKYWYIKGFKIILHSNSRFTDECFQFWEQFRIIYNLLISSQLQVKYRFSKNWIWLNVGFKCFGLLSLRISNIAPESGYPDTTLIVFFSLRRHFYSTNLKQDTTDSFNIRSNSTFKKHCTIRRCVNYWADKGSLHKGKIDVLLGCDAIWTLRKTPTFQKHAISIFKSRHRYSYRPWWWRKLVPETLTFNISHAVDRPREFYSIYSPSKFKVFHIVSKVVTVS